MSVTHSPAGQEARPRHVVPTRRPRLRMTLYIVGGALLLIVLMAAGSFLGAPSTATSGSGPALSTPVALTTLDQGVVATDLRDSQGHFHLLYISTTAQHTFTLMYEAVSVSGQDAQVLTQPVTLTAPVDTISQPTLLLDSQDRVHATWIEVSNGIISVRHALVATPTNQSLSITPDTLYSFNGAVTALSAGADAQGDTFYAWLDNASGTLNLRFSELDASLTAHAPIQVTHQSDMLAFEHLAVYPDGTLAALILHQPDIQTPADLSLYPFDATGKSLHAPTLVASHLVPEPLNIAGGATAGREPDVFQNDPLAAKLDAQGTLHIAWAAGLGLGYARATLNPDDSFAVQGNPTLDQMALDFQQLCLNVGPPTLPGQATAGSAPEVWLSWIDDHLGDGGLHPYIAQVSPKGTLTGTPTPLVDQVTAATDPCVQQDSNEGLYVTWQQFNGDSYELVMATTTVAPSNTWWAALGLSLNHPIEQLIFIVFGSPVVGLLLLLITLLSIPVVALVIRLGKWLHVPRLVVLLIALIPLLYLSIFAQGFLAINFNATVPLIRTLIGCAVIVAMTLYLWYRSRRYPPETMGTIGQLLVAVYLGAIVLAAPIIYLATRVQLG